MSLQSRARNLQSVTSLSYQKCHQVILALGDAPSALASKFKWPLKRADVFLFDPQLDPEYRDASERGRHVVEATCVECNRTFFRSLDKKGYTDDPETFCPSCIEEAGSLFHCPRCGCELLEVPDGPCDDCWTSIMSED